MLASHVEDESGVYLERTIACSAYLENITITETGVARGIWSAGFVLGAK